MTAEMSVIGEVPPFGRLVRAHRSRIGLTQRELADFSTISVRAIRDLEQGKARRPRQETVRLIADALRLGHRARTALESAANRGRASWELKAAYDADPPLPPTAASALIGRDPLSAALASGLASGTDRLVEVVGLSGVGKTRLALEVAARLHADAEFPVLWHAISDGAAEYRRPSGHEGLAAVVRACAEELFGSAQPSPALVRLSRMRPDPHGEQDCATFAELVGDQAALLVIDGVPDASEPRLARIARLLHDCPQLRVLITAERPCGIPGGRLLALDPLEVPGARDKRDAEALGQVPAVRLFLDEARRVRPDFAPTTAAIEAVAEICRRLDGLPGALKAAASWLVVYDLETLRQCLGGDPVGLLNHLAGTEGTVRIGEALDRRVDALPAASTTLLAALSATSGDFSLEDVAALTGLSLPDCGRMVHDLLMHGVVCPRAGGGRSRFRVLNLIRAARLAAECRGDRAMAPPSAAIASISR
jgi:transcriptional regulator with XRE-family HTH domain